ncbi:MBL fold hydrolase [Streptomyces agglomeratus]|uniref:Metallo-beta-lactamase domain-containing protein 1 n=1 Tax=Streptomyces agglomeratus TaxID=285458 RepID=A0A1E5PC52_9ACTN|nr:MBL fold metallo-hydrolase [Streptomyces agglomeratus]OEJ27087.1 MBL fold hydrolase [Streptomyces agglomeratus]OEJ42318.1 MBL fold hydrolase [Streptomyces agglomeratus]OEJ49174.1 MBL fold hydrolase [Streptomyces agglomeratus]OEJ55629.1 MBL fold hydrolase [Streptomyces agglomeratus]OEJ63015.1 MBL fold hydrolase [Streptomyces agglomeratus]
MSDAPRGRTAGYTILTTGYTTSTGPGVAATVSYVSDGDLRIVIDPGMVAGRDRILGPLAAMGVGADDITDVVLSHHHPDNIINAGLFGRARMHDHKAIYHGDQWTDRDAEGYELTPSVRLIRTPGHSREDVTVLVGTPDEVVAFVGDLWWRPNGPVEDPVSPDLAQLRASRERVLAIADVIVPGHGGAFPADASAPL